MRRDTSGRLGHLDWLRGWAVLVMILGHVLDAWTLPPDRETKLFGYSMIVGGFAAPLFLLLAGTAVALSADSKARRVGLAAAGASVRRRGWEIFGLALLFRLQAYLLSPGSSAIGLLKVDILNIMGPSMVMAGACWQLARTPRRRLLFFAAITVAIGMLTPIVRAAPWLDWLPDPLEWYLRPSAGHTNFVMFPWAAFVFAGAGIGVLLDRAVTSNPPVLNRRFLVWGLALAAAGYGASYLPAIYERTNFWTSSPTYFFLRLGVLVALVGLAYYYSQWAGSSWSPLAQFGRTSLFIYWIHVEMVYGWVSGPLHKSLTVQQSYLAYGLLTVALFGVSVAKTWVVSRWERRSG